MARTKRKPISEADLSTICVHCSYAIPPREVVRVSFEEVRCPKCGQAFTPSAE